MINNPHALYYNGELIGIITNPDPYPGGIADICDQLSPNEGLADAVTIPVKYKNHLVGAVEACDVSETIELEPNEFDDEDYQEAD